MSLSPHHSTAQTGAASVKDVCKRTDARLHSSESRLYTAFNAKTLRYEIWRDCPSGEQALIHVLEGQGGAFVHPDNYPIQVRLHAMDQAQPGRSPQKLIQGIQATNERVQRGDWDRDKDEIAAMGEYVRPWIEQAERGQPRYTAEDVIDGVKAAHGG
jgi:hypothetical protein